MPALARTSQPVPPELSAEVLVDRSKWDMNERNRVLAALEANGWRRQDTASHLGISRKVLWEKCASSRSSTKNLKRAS